MQSGPSTNSRVQKKPVQPAPPQRRVEQFVLDDEEIEEIPLPKASPRKAKRMRVDSEAGLDDVHENTSFKRSRQSAEEQEEIEADELFEDDRNEPQQPEIPEPMEYRETPILTPKQEYPSDGSEQGPSHNPANRNESPGLIVSPGIVVLSAHAALKTEATIFRQSPST